MDHCFKCYLPVSGAATLFMDESEVALRPGRVYLFDGRRLRRQQCARAMQVYWVHFTPASLYLQRRLELAPALSSWPVERVADADALRALPLLFERPFTPASHRRERPSTLWACRVQACLLLRVAEHLQRTPEEALTAFSPRYLRLRPAIDFMTRQLRDPPPLARIAAVAGQSPEHFHRQFRALTGVTPFAYMLRLRMARARQLLHAGLRVQEAADQCGYVDPLYFSRVFTRFYHQTPSACRRVAAGG